MTNGQDWASYQASEPPTTGLGFVFVKTTEGLGYTNPKRTAQVAHARTNGLVVGHYHYPHMAGDPKAEADFFLKAAAPLPGDVLVLDWEGYDDANDGVPMARQIAYKAAFLAHVAAVRPLHQLGTYANTDYLNRDPAGPYGDFLWIATASRPAGQPGIAHSWLFHQYSTAGGVDHDYCPLTLAELKSWAHAKENADMPLTADDLTKVGATVQAELRELLDVRLPRLDDPTKTMYLRDHLRGVGVAAAVRASAQQTVTAVVKGLAPLIGTGVDTAAVVAACREAIASTVVHVDVDVHDTATEGN